MKNKISNEYEFEKWFEKNFRKLGYAKILKKNKDKFPDYIMIRDNEKVRVELELRSSNFILHKHDKKKVDEIVCITKDIDLGIPTKEIKKLVYEPQKVRISATIDDKTMNIVKILLKRGKYRNKSHVIEEAIKLLKSKKK